jgi:predicted DNA binding CopG/RHH family protein
MRIDNLSEDEKLIEDGIDLLIPISGKKKEKVSKIISKAKKNRSISLRISNYELGQIKERANAEGIPYQTLINSILHKYITDQLFEKDQVIRSFNLISKA